VYPDKQQGNIISTKMYYFSDLKRSLYIDYFEYSKIIRSLSPYLDNLPQLVDKAVIVGLVFLPFLGGVLWTSVTLLGLSLLTLIIWLVAKIMKSSYEYNALFRMGMHGVTWSILFTFLLEMTNQQVPYLYNLIFIGWMMFVLTKLNEKKVVV